MYDLYFLFVDSCKRFYFMVTCVILLVKKDQNRKRKMIYMLTWAIGGTFLAIELIGVVLLSCYKA